MQKWRVIVLTRQPRWDDEVRWDGKTVGSWIAELDGADAVINLAGKSVDCRYTRRNREEILSSRVDSTRAIGEAIAKCCSAPRVWLNASTATIYKHTFHAAHSESGKIGSDPEANDEFSIEVAKRWEQALKNAQVSHTRKVALRTAMVLGHGGNSVFPTLCRLAKFGLGGGMGSGEQFVSWIHERDFCRAVHWIIENDDLSGPINVAAPNPMTNREMMRALRDVLGVPFGIPAAGWMLDLGAFFLRTEVELILKSRRVIPARLLESGFQFEYTKMRQAFWDLAGALEEKQNAQRAITERRAVA